MGIDRTRRITFEENAVFYKETRPGYPEQLVEDIISLSRIPANGKILEIGCGPGNATVAFARRGFEIHAIELGPTLSKFAEDLCRPYPKAKIINSAFEDWKVEEAAYNLAISADAFHWIVPEVGYPRVAKALRKGCSLAFFWNVTGELDPPLQEAIAEEYTRHAPDADNPNRGYTPEWLIETICSVINASGCYKEIAVRQYDAMDRLTADQYVRRLWTYSSHRPLANSTRIKLYEGIENAINEHGGVIEEPRKIVLFHTFVKK